MMMRQSPAASLNPGKLLHQVSDVRLMLRHRCEFCSLLAEGTPIRPRIGTKSHLVFPDLDLRMIRVMATITYPAMCYLGRSHSATVSSWTAYGIGEYSALARRERSRQRVVRQHTKFARGTIAATAHTALRSVQPLRPLCAIYNRLVALT
jgi:hypothetical protein